MERKILVSITGTTRRSWQDKIVELQARRIREAAVFLSALPAKEKRGLLPAIAKSGLKKIPLVHLRDDTTRAELQFFYRRYGTRYFTIHERHFPVIGKWRGYYRHLYLEMSTDNRVAPYVEVEKIGGFCLDLAHFQKQARLTNKDFAYLEERLNTVRCACNHLSGYSRHRNMDLHTTRSVSQFDYIFSLPHNLFGRVIAVEVFNPIRDQLRIIEHVRKFIASI